MLSYKSNSFARKNQDGINNTSRNDRKGFSSLSIKSFRASASFLNHFSRSLHLLVSENLQSIPEIERAVSIDIIVTTCLRNKLQILSAKYASLLTTFSIVCLILKACIWRYFWFCGSILSFAYCLVFRLSSL